MNGAASGSSAYQVSSVRTSPGKRFGRGCGGLFLVACLLLALPACGASAGGQAGPTPQAARFSGQARGANPADRGATVATKNWRLTVTDVDRTPTLVWNRFGARQDAVGTWLLVGIDLENVGKQNFGVNGWDFDIEDGTGNVYKHTSEWAALGYPETRGALPAHNRQIPPGTVAPLILIFDVNPNATGLHLVFRQERNPRVDLGR